jgi:hypothetical protein
VKGGSVVDPVLVQELVDARRAEDPLDVLSPREREVLSLMARAARTRASPISSGSPKGRSRSTSTASSRSCACPRRRTISAAFSP